jgi:hypothetical protein
VWVEEEGKRLRNAALTIISIRTIVIMSFGESFGCRRLVSTLTATTPATTEPDLISGVAKKNDEREGRAMAVETIMGCGLSGFAET